MTFLMLYFSRCQFGHQLNIWVGFKLWEDLPNRRLIMWTVSQCKGLSDWWPGYDFFSIEVEEYENLTKKFNLSCARKFIQIVVAFVGSISTTYCKMSVWFLITSKSVQNITTPQFEGRSSIYQSISRWVWCAIPCILRDSIYQTITLGQRAAKSFRYELSVDQIMIWVSPAPLTGKKWKRGN